MKKFFFMLALCCSLGVAAASNAPQVPQEPPRFDFTGVSVLQVIQLIYGEALQGPYVIEPEVMTDQRPVSFRYDARSGDLRAFIAAFLDSLGLVAIRRSGVDFIGKKPPPAEKAAEVRDVFVYVPRHRDGSYLVDLLSPLFKGEFTARRAVHASASDKSAQLASPPGSAAASIDRKSDILVFAGIPAEVTMLKKLLSQVDTAIGDVLVRGVLYEVQTTNNDGSAFSLALNLLGGKFGLSFGSIGNSNSSHISFKSTTIDAVLSSLSTDSRFTVKSTPTLRVQSGQSGRFTVGEDVPVLGAVSYPSSGAAVQSVEYRSSGLIFELLPVIHESSVDLQVLQQMSSFVSTNTGVNNSPTLIKRELKTSLSVADGELIVIGGLTEDKDATAHTSPSWLPKLNLNKTRDKNKTEMVLILQLTKV
ncbi:general secretion pathway protein D [Massilia sp. MP_M2]|uniref:type II secretion system protein GspD n=1 Tax=Massilia sp. MP_M2 TaxID=3071713 RepID=UPI00319E1242